MQMPNTQSMSLLNDSSYSDTKWDQFVINCFNTNNIDIAIESLKLALKKFGSNYHIYWNIVLCSLSKKDIEQFEYYLYECTKNNPPNSACYLLLGELSFKKNLINQMNDFFFKAIEMEPYILTNNYIRTAPPYLKNALILSKQNYKHQQKIISNKILKNVKHLGCTKRLEKCFLQMGNKDNSNHIEKFKPGMLYFPDIRNQQFYDESEFPQLDILNKNSELILSEFNSISESFKNYINLHLKDKTLEIQEFKDIENEFWKSFHLFRYGEIKSNCKKCPITTKVLKTIGMPYAGKIMPEAFFSKLGKHSAIPEHYGLTNIRLAVHWPIIVNDNCFIEVGGIKRKWELNTPMIFDDSFLHQAQNNSDLDRIVLIFDMWHPDLTEVEIEGLKQMLNWAQPEE